MAEPRSAYDARYYQEHGARKREYARQRYANDPERFKTAMKEWRKTHPERVREQGLKYKYGMTWEQYSVLLVEQDGKCRICLVGMAIPRVDHNHQTLEVRGLLCNNCNIAIGMLEDDIERAQRLVQYLIEFNCA